MTLNARFIFISVSTTSLLSLASCDNADVAIEEDESLAEAPSEPTAQAIQSTEKPDISDQQTGPISDHLAAMQGSWVSIDDPKSEVKISGSLVEDVYDGEKFGSVPITFVNDCDEKRPDVKGDSFTLGDDGALCYVIDSVNGDEMSYVYAARGKSLRFKRK